MSPKVYFPNWKDVVVYATQGVQPCVLAETENYKCVIMGLAAGNSRPPHVESPTIFHFLEGTGRMTVGEESFSVQAGATVVVPEGARRGIEADTPLAFLAVRLYP